MSSSTSTTSSGHCIVFGGSGFVGSHLLPALVASGRFARIVNADLSPPPVAVPGVEFVECDLRQPLDRTVLPDSADWIIHLAARCREPGFEREEYFLTNFNGTIHVVEYAEAIGCRNIYFTSSMATYGPTRFQADESYPQAPNTAYGASKLAAEWVMMSWQQREPSARRLIMSRPGVMYGPGDIHNIPRLIKAVRKGIFVLPGFKPVYKSYGYVPGLVDSIFFTMDRPDPVLVYNYVENESLSVEELARVVKKHFAVSLPLLRLPLWPLKAMAAVIAIVTSGRSAIHPVRVQKVATSTHLAPGTLRRLGFPFRWTFATSLEDWIRRAPEDFGFDCQGTNSLSEMSGAAPSVPAAQALRLPASLSAPEIMPPVSIIIPTLNAAGNIARTLEGIASQQGVVRPEVLVIDSSSTDGTADIVRQKFPWVRLMVIPKEEFHHARTRNMGVRETSHDLVVFLQGDAWPASPHWLRNLIHPLVVDDRLVAAYGRQIPKEECNRINRIRYAWNYPSASSRRNIEDVPRLQHRTFFFSTANAVLRRSVWETYPFPDDIDIFEDTAFAFLVVSKGHELAYVAEAAVIHSHNLEAPALHERYRHMGFVQTKYQFIPNPARSLFGDSWSYMLFGLKRLFVSGRWHIIPNFLYTGLRSYFGFIRGVREARELQAPS